MRKSYTITSVHNLAFVAKELLNSCPDKEIFAFLGSMGAGKTTFIKAICEVLGVENVVNSPTFSIVNEYIDAKGKSVFHFDFYRINSEQEAINIGYHEYIDSGYMCLMEWPEKIENLLPEMCVYVSIISEDTSELRTISWEV